MTAGRNIPSLRRNCEREQNVGEENYVDGSVSDWSLAMWMGVVTPVM
jgi:hypothetical protein